MQRLGDDSNHGSEAGSGKCGVFGLSMTVQHDSHAQNKARFRVGIALRGEVDAENPIKAQLRSASLA